MGWVMPAEVWTRVVGYMRPVQNWNPGKQQEFSERKVYDKVFKEEINAENN
jgi:ribonucleoside-triphosphate reductase (formate)